MWMVAALAFMPLAAVIFGTLAILVLVFPDLTRTVDIGASLLYGAAVLSIVVALPLSWLAARRMTTRRDRRMLQR